MSAVAAEAGVATGTAYVHYASKDELVLAVYAELKHGLGAAAGGTDRPGLRPRPIGSCSCGPGSSTTSSTTRTGPASCCRSTARHTAHEPTRWPSPQPAADPLLAEVGAPDVAALLAPLPLPVLYDLAFGPVLRIVATGRSLTPRQRAALADSCWRAVSR